MLIRTREVCPATHSQIQTRADYVEHYKGLEAGVKNISRSRIKQISNHFCAMATAPLILAEILKMYKIGCKISSWYMLFLRQSQTT